MLKVYKFTSDTSGKVYIGSTVSFRKRILEHKCRAEYQQHNHLHLYAAINKYGWSDFRIEIIEFTCPLFRNDRENYWIDYYDSVNSGYNMISADHKILSNDTRARLSEIQKNRPPASIETRQKMSKTRTGMKRSLDSRRKQGESNKGKSSGMLGKKHTEETKKKFSDSRKGRESWNKGKKHTQAAIDRMRASQRRRQEIARQALAEKK